MEAYPAFLPDLKTGAPPATLPPGKFGCCAFCLIVVVLLDLHFLDFAVGAHLDVWDRVVERRRSEGRTATFLAEFGPTDYATPDPRTGGPLGDPEQSNLWLMRLLRDRYARADAVR